MREQRVVPGRARHALGAPEAQVDHLGGGRVGRNAGNREARCPRDAVEDVGEVPSALAEHAHRQDARRPIDARDGESIVRVGRDDASDRRAMPARALLLAIGELAAFDVGLRHPVARVGRIRIAAVAVVGRVDVADEVVSRKDPAREVGVRQDARVENGNHDRRRAGRDVPRAVRAHRRVVVRQVPLRRHERVVRDRRALQAPVGHGDLRAAARHRGLRGRVRVRGAIELDKVDASRHPPHVTTLDAGLARHLRYARRRREGRLDVVVAELDDQPRARGVGGGGRRERAGERHPKQCRVAGEKSPHRPAFRGASSR